MQEQNKWNDLIPFYVARTLPPVEMRAFEARLARDEVLRREVEEWRTIAGAVWREADQIARSVPPLSADVLTRARQMRPAGAIPATTYDAESAPTGMTQRVRAVRNSQSTSVPVTLVAGLLLAFVCGGLLVMLAFNNARQQPQPLVAQLGTGTASDGGFAAADATGTSAAIAALITREPGILPTPTNTIMPVPTQTPSSISTSQPMNPNLMPPTLTIPGTENLTTLLVDECLVLNNLSAPVNIYQSPDRTSVVVEQIQPGESRASIVRSDNNWFMMFTPDRGIIGWVAFEDVSITTACNSLPVATPVVTTTPLPPVALTPATPGQEIIITASFIDLREYPGTGYQIITTAGRNARFVLDGMTVNPFGEQWAATTLSDGRQVWLPFEEGMVEMITPISYPTYTPTLGVTPIQP